MGEELRKGGKGDFVFVPRNTRHAFQFDSETASFLTGTRPPDSSWPSPNSRWPRRLDVIQRLIQAGATPTNVQAIVGELQNSTMNKDPATAKGLMPQMMAWIGTYKPAPSMISMNGDYKSK